MPVGKGTKSWEILFSMQHYGVPTRLLDWTTVFSIAFYFSIKDSISSKENDVAIWALNPYLLNKLFIKTEVIWTPTDHDPDSQDYFKHFIQLDKCDAFACDVVAMSPTKSNPRLTLQHGVFTFHKKLMPLDEMPESEKYLTKILINKELIKNCEKILTMLGINEYFVFPDVHGLGSYIKKKYFPAHA